MDARSTPVPTSPPAPARPRLRGRAGAAALACALLAGAPSAQCLMETKLAPGLYDSVVLGGGAKYGWRIARAGEWTFVSSMGFDAEDIEVYRALGGLAVHVDTLEGGLTHSTAFGFRLDEDGATMITSRSLDSYFGGIAVFDLSGDAWVETDLLLTPGTPVGGPQPPTELALHGDTIAGTRGDLWGTPTNRVDVYERSAGAWSHVATLAGDLDPVVGNFGRALDVHGDALVVGDPYDYEAGAPLGGAVHVFRRLDSGWSETQKLVPDAPVYGLQFGAGLKLKDGWLGVSTSHADDVHVYHDVDGRFELVTKLPAPIGGGISVLAIRPGMVVTAIPGGVRIWTGGVDAASWTVAHEFATLGGIFSAALEHDRLWLGHPYEDPTGPDTGSVTRWSLDPADCPTFTADVPALSLGGAQAQTLTFRAPAGLAGKTYRVLGTTAGVWPGVWIAGWTVPLNPSPYGAALWAQPDGPFFQGGAGVLDAAAQATATFSPTAAAFGSLVGVTLHHAALALDPALGALRHVSVPVACMLAP